MTTPTIAPNILAAADELDSLSVPGGMVTA